MDKASTIEQIANVESALNDIAAYMLKKSQEVGTYLSVGRHQVPVTLDDCKAILRDCLFDHQLFDLHEELNEK